MSGELCKAPFVFEGNVAVGHSIIVTSHSRQPGLEPWNLKERLDLYLRTVNVFTYASGCSERKVERARKQLIPKTFNSSQRSVIWDRL